MRHRALTFLAVSIFCSTSFAQETSEQFRKLDLNKDGKVTKDEFSGPLFDQIDTDKDGVITAEEDQAFQKRRAGGAGQPPRIPDSVTAELDLPYAATENPRQRLDLYLPKNRKNEEPLPVVVFIHGGGWQNGDKRGGFGMLRPILASGEYAGVSVGYRLTDEAMWPAQIHDCKAAIRWIKANAKKYNLDPNHIGVTGTSAGGHLVAMLGTSGDVKELEGSLGEHPEVSSRVACVVDQYGPTDMLTMGGRHNNPGSPEAKLLGGAIPEHKDMAINASPTTYVSKDDPPFMFIHGTKDPTVPFQQSELLDAALKKAGVESLLIPVTRRAHGNFNAPELGERFKQFFDKYLLGKVSEISSEPIKAGEPRPPRT